MHSLCDVSGDDTFIEQPSLFALVYLDPEYSSRARVFLSDSATLLSPSEALELDFISFGVEDLKTGVGTDDTGCVCCSSKPALLLMIAPKLPKVTPRMFYASAENFESAALEVVD